MHGFCQLPIYVLYVVFSLLNVPLVFLYKMALGFGSSHVGGPTCDDTTTSTKWNRAFGRVMFVSQDRSNIYLNFHFG